MLVYLSEIQSVYYDTEHLLPLSLVALVVVLIDQPYCHSMSQMIPLQIDITYLSINLRFIYK